jgi:hypothetical protein
MSSIFGVFPTVCTTEEIAYINEEGEFEQMKHTSFLETSSQIKVQLFK